MPPIANDLKIIKKTAYTVKKMALKPIITGPLSKAVKVDADHLTKFPTYKHSLNLEFKAIESLTIDLIKL